MLQTGAAAEQQCKLIKVYTEADNIFLRFLFLLSKPHSELCLKALFNISLKIKNT